MSKGVISLPSARRLITSLRDLGYGLTDAVAEIVDNSIQAGANFVHVTVKFSGVDSYICISDNGMGMSPTQIREAMRFGATRDYSSEDLGKFGLGLKTASLSQCDELIVASRQGAERARIGAYCWSIPYVMRSDRWEILPIPSDELPLEMRDHLHSTTGTVVWWRGLSRLVGYRWPEGKYAEREASRMVSELMLGLGTIFHKFLTGEGRIKRVGIFVNETPVQPWDPYCRNEDKTAPLDPIQVPVSFKGKSVNLQLRPYLLPSNDSFSTQSAFVRAGGLKKWNKQQGFYIYRASRLLQSGGWCGMRTSDEHTKLVRIAVDIPAGMDELFKVNISKMRVYFPSEIRLHCLDALAPVIRLAQERYRHSPVELADTTELPVLRDTLIRLRDLSVLSLAEYDDLAIRLRDSLSSVERRLLKKVLDRVLDSSKTVKNSRALSN